MRSVLLSWIGHTDLRAPEETDVTGVGPVAQALGARAFDHAFLVADHDGEPISRYREWLDARVAGTVLSLLHEPLTGPTEFGEIYEAAVRACEQALGGDRGDQPLAVRGGGGRPLQGRPLPPAGWGWDTEVELGPGRVNLTGDTMYDASQRIVADYVLRLWRMPLAILEAKAEGNPASDGMQQASRYAQRLGLRFSIASNVRAFSAFDATERVVVDKGVVARRDHLVGKVFFANYQNLDEVVDGRKLFEHLPADFCGLVVVDECHRSGFGDWFGARSLRCVLPARADRDATSIATTSGRRKSPSASLLPSS